MLSLFSFSLLHRKLTTEESIFLLQPPRSSRNNRICGPCLCEVYPINNVPKRVSIGPLFSWCDNGICPWFPISRLYPNNLTGCPQFIFLAHFLCRPCGFALEFVTLNKKKAYLTVQENLLWFKNCRTEEENWNRFKWCSDPLSWAVFNVPLPRDYY